MSSEIIPDKTFFKIGEVSRIVGVEPYNIRYWESQFGHIRPTKTKSGQRLYRKRDIENLIGIRRLLYEEGFTIAGAKKRLKSERQNSASSQAEPAGLATEERSAYDQMLSEAQSAATDWKGKSEALRDEFEGARREYARDLSTLEAEREELARRVQQQESEFATRTPNPTDLEEAAHLTDRCAVLEAEVELLHQTLTEQATKTNHETELTDSLKADLATAAQEWDAQRQALEDGEAERAQLRSRVEELTQSLAEQQSSDSEQAEHGAALRNECEALRAERAALIAERTSLTQEFGNQVLRSEEQRRTLEATRASLEKARSRADDLDMELDSARRALPELTAERRSLTEALEGAKAEITEARGQIEDLKVTLVSARAAAQETAELRSELRVRRERISEVESELEDARGRRRALMLAVEAKLKPLLEHNTGV